LEDRFGIGHQLSRRIINKARIKPKRVVFPEGNHEKIIRAARQIVDERIGIPILLGNEEKVKEAARELEVSLEGVELKNHLICEDKEKYVQAYFDKRHRKGITHDDAKMSIKNPIVFGALMVDMGIADCMLSGIRQHYPDTIRPALQLIELKDNYSTVCGVFMLILKNKAYFFADTTVNLDPTAEQLVDITIMCANAAKRFNIEPRVALISYSNFGSVRNEDTDKIRKAVTILQENHPELVVDGEMQADTAVTPDIASDFPFSKIQGDANCMIFPKLEAGNVAYKLIQKLAGAEILGPMLCGLKKPVHVLHRSQGVEDIVNMAAIAVIEANGS